MAASFVVSYAVAGVAMKRILEFSRHLAKEWFGFRAILRQDRDVFDAEMVKAFDKAKKLSDFIGMIVRLTFAMVFVAYCFTKAHDTTSWLYKYSYRIAGGFGAAITAYFGFLISRIVFEYFMRDVGAAKQYWLKVIVLFISLFLFWSVFTTILDVAQHAAKFAQ